MDPTTLKIILSFVVGSFWVTATTVIAEKFGTKIGGLIAGLPSTVLISLFFIAWTQNPEAAVKATTIGPIIGGINCIFIVIYAAFVKSNFWLSLFLALAFWCITTSILVIIHFNSIYVSLIAYVILLITAYEILENLLKVQSAPSTKIKYTPAKLIFRALLTGSIIAIGVTASKFGGPVIGGTFAFFPAVYTSTLIIAYYSSGANFSTGIMKIAIISGISIVVYDLAVRLTYSRFDLLIGTFLSIFVSLASALIINKFIISKTK